MAFFRRKHRVDLGTYEPAQQIPPAPIERVVEEGLLIATTAVRMHVKNHIIMNAIKWDAPFDPVALAAETSSEFESIADQNDGYAANQTEERYGTIHHSLADALRGAAADADLVASTVEEAREQAWEEISSALVTRLGARAGDPLRDPNYERERATRLRTFLAVDLARLTADTRDTY